MESSRHAIVVDELPLARAGIGALLHDAGISVRAATHAAREAETFLALDGRSAGAAGPTLTVLGVPADLRLADAARRLSRVRPRPAIVALVPSAEVEATGYLAALGVLGLASRNGPIEDVATAIAAAASDEQFVAAALQPSLAGSVRLRDLAADHGLTTREREVLAHLAAGRSNREIATALSVTVATVKSHLVRIYSKLGATSRREALGRAVALGLVR